jgi:hypothetical protein
MVCVGLRVLRVGIGLENSLVGRRYGSWGRLWNGSWCGTGGCDRATFAGSGAVGRGRGRLQGSLGRARKSLPSYLAFASPLESIVLGEVVVIVVDSDHVW